MSDTTDVSAKTDKRFTPLHLKSTVYTQENVLIKILILIGS